MVHVLPNASALRGVGYGDTVGKQVAGLRQQLDRVKYITKFFFKIAAVP